MSDLNALSLSELYQRLSGGGLVRRLCELARDEDLGVGPGAGDATSEACIEAGARTRAALVARSAGTIAGLAALGELIEVYRADVRLRLEVTDGDSVAAGTTIATLSGSRRDVLAIERPALNLVGRLSGVASTAAEFVRAVKTAGPSRAAIYDIRKTTPGLRVLEKYAVRCGGGKCHRIGLFDAVLMKDNHLAGVPIDRLAAVVAEAAKRARAMRNGLAFVEVEVESLEQLRRVLALPRGTVDIVLLDNMSLDAMSRAVEMRDASESRPELEASGGVSLNTVAAIARTGVERISAGALTHGAVWMDVALDTLEGGEG